MKALSVKQPWAWAIMSAGKDIENRDWSTSFRGTVAIHASKGMTRDEYDQVYFFVREQEGLWHAIESLPPFEKLDRGAILGTVNITGCVRSSASPWFMGDYGFVLSDPRLLAEPIPCKGQLGFWQVPDDAFDENGILRGLQAA